MNDHPTLRLLVEGLGYLSVIIASLSAAYGMRTKANLAKAAIDRGVDPRSLPDIGAKPLLLLILGGALLAYLFAQHPEIAQRVLPPANSAEFASGSGSAKCAPSAPVSPQPLSATYCTKASDCASGCCDRGSCGCIKLETISTAPMAVGCTSASDCRSGCACTGGQCTPCSALEKKPKPQPPQKKPRLLASLHREACAGCEVMPQMILAVGQPF